MENQLKKYFLKTLTEAETEVIDLRLISDADFEGDLLLARNNLMEDYLDDALSPDEVKSFKQNFLDSEERAKELINLALLKTYARRKMAEETAIEQHKSSAGNFFDRLDKFFKVNLRPVAVGFAAVFLIAVFIGYSFLNSGGKELAELNRKDFTNVDEYLHLTNLNLISATFRNANATVKLSADKLIDPVFLRLALPLENELFDVNITRNEEKFASNLRVRSYSNQNGRELRLLLPSSDLTKGRYKIEVFPADSKNMPVVYSFTIE